MSRSAKISMVAALVTFTLLAISSAVALAYNGPWNYDAIVPRFGGDWYSELQSASGVQQKIIPLALAVPTMVTCGAISSIHPARKWQRGSRCTVVIGRTILAVQTRDSRLVSSLLVNFGFP